MTDRDEPTSATPDASVGRRRVRVLVVDDSPTMRRLIVNALGADPLIDVVGVAEDAYEARRQVKALAPDVLTLDVEMPRMDGVTFLQHLMSKRPTPVVMVSSFTRPGADIARRALALGAVACVDKPTPGNRDALKRLPTEVRAAASANLARFHTPPPEASRPQAERPDAYALKRDAIVMIGASTGGVDAIETLLRAFPGNCPPTLIVQHMPAAYSEGFAARLDGIAEPTVRLATDGAVLRQGEVLFAPGGDHHLQLDQGAGVRCKLKAGPKIEGHRPSVNALFESAVPFAKRVAAALLTGIGADGAAGLTALRAAGASTFAQDEASSIVYGMPKAALAMGAVDTSTPLSKIGGRLLAACSDRSVAALRQSMGISDG
ncbi:MAG: chemotaxis response regulator protein-glutamate methylesterase [Pseudomonadota bacterium]